MAVLRERFAEDAAALGITLKEVVGSSRARRGRPGKSRDEGEQVEGGYARPKLAGQLTGQPVDLEIVKHTDKDRGFKVVRWRWVIERTFS